MRRLLVSVIMFLLMNFHIAYPSHHAAGRTDNDTDKIDKNTPSSITHFSILSRNDTPEIAINHTDLYFASILSSSAKTPTQTVMITNSGAGTLRWDAEKFAYGGDKDVDWLKLSTSPGIESAILEIWVDPLGLPEGTYTGIITITSTLAANSPQIINVSLTVFPKRTNAETFGTFDTPGDGSTVMSSIPVTGWVLDDIGIKKVSLWRNPVYGEAAGNETGVAAGKIYVGDAVLVEGARPDVEISYPTYPMNYKAGWGYMMLTNGLPNGGNGVYIIHAYAENASGDAFLLGSKTIYCDNANAVKPFGAIDSPAQGSTIHGSKYRNQGWVLTPQPHIIPQDGSTLHAYIDGQNIGTLAYNYFRKDISEYFPGYMNSNGAMAFLDIDTSDFSDGIHTIQWTATDNAGNTDGIGSRFFTIYNPGYTRPASLPNKNNPALSNPHPRLSTSQIKEIMTKPPQQNLPLIFATGHAAIPSFQSIHPGQHGCQHVTLAQDQRLIIQPAQLDAQLVDARLLVNNQVRPLPIGSSLNPHHGTFYWQVGPGFLGEFSFILIFKHTNDSFSYQEILIDVLPKFSPAKNIHPLDINKKI